MMPDAAQADALIARLSADLRPVHRLAPAWRRAVLWLAAVVWIGALLSFFTDWGALRTRLTGAPDMWLSLAGAVLTAVCASVAALQISVPGRSVRWAWLPLPALAVWMAACTQGCLRLAPVAATVPEPRMHAMACLQVIVLISLPLTLLLTWQLMRAYPLRPGLTAALGGLASAGAAASLLTLVHPFDATLDDLAVHGAAILAVVGVARWLGGRALRQVDQR